MNPEALRGFGPAGIVALLVILFAGNWTFGPMITVPAGGLLVLLWRSLSQTPWRDIGYVRPRSWAGTIVLGIVIGAAYKLLMKAFVMPLLGAEPVNPAYHFLAGNRALLPGAILTMLAAGFGEETVFRGFLFERLGRWLGTNATAKIAMVIATSLVFGAAHYSGQGLAGAEQALFSGLLLGTIFAITGSIFLPMIIHAAFDITAVLLIYNNLETRVAHWIFK